MTRLDSSSVEELQLIAHAYLPPDAILLLDQLVMSWRRQAVTIQQLTSLSSQANGNGHVNGKTVSPSQGASDTLY